MSIDFYNGHVYHKNLKFSFVGDIQSSSSQIKKIQDKITFLVSFSLPFSLRLVFFAEFNRLIAEDFFDFIKNTESFATHWFSEKLQDLLLWFGNVDYDLANVILEFFENIKEFILNKILLGSEKFETTLDKNKVKMFSKIYKPLGFTDLSLPGILISAFFQFNAPPLILYFIFGFNEIILLFFLFLLFFNILILGKMDNFLFSLNSLFVINRLIFLSLIL